MKGKIIISDLRADYYTTCSPHALVWFVVEYTQVQSEIFH